MVVLIVLTKSVYDNILCTECNKWCHEDRVELCVIIKAPHYQIAFNDVQVGVLPEEQVCKTL